MCGGRFGGLLFVIRAAACSTRKRTLCLRTQTKVLSQTLVAVPTELDKLHPVKGLRAQTPLYAAFEAKSFSAAVTNSRDHSVGDFGRHRSQSGSVTTDGRIPPDADNRGSISMMETPIDLEAIRINPTDPTLVPVRASRRRGRKLRYFVKVPWDWVEKLDGAAGQTYRLALNLLFLHWQGRGAAVTLSNRTVERDGIPGQSKRRAVCDLEGRGLVVVNWRSKRSPIVRVLAGLDH